MSQRKSSQLKLSPSELSLIRRIQILAAGAASGTGLRLGIGDDCAVLRQRRGEDLTVTTDLSIADRHFRLDWHPPEAIGHRTLARGLSDLAAMGARPIAAFLSLGLPRELVETGKRSSAQPGKTAPHQTWVDRFLDGFFRLANAHKTPLAGGDLAESPIAVADIVLIGGVTQGKALLRSGARAGDLLYVTGKLGGSIAGLKRLAELASSNREKQAGKRQTGGLRIPKGLDGMLAPHLYPEPRIAQGVWLARHGAATAALDISDGLSTDLKHLCEESGVCAEVDAASLPLHDGATLEQALHGGEDYELLFTAKPDVRVPRAIARVPVTRIGRITQRRAGKPQMVLVTKRKQEPLIAQGWEHFAP